MSTTSLFSFAHGVLSCRPRITATLATALAITFADLPSSHHNRCCFMLNLLRDDTQCPNWPFHASSASSTLSGRPAPVDAISANLELLFPRSILRALAFEATVFCIIHSCPYLFQSSRHFALISKRNPRAESFFGPASSAHRHAPSSLHGRGGGVVHAVLCLSLPACSVPVRGSFASRSPFPSKFGRNVWGSQWESDGRERGQTQCTEHSREGTHARNRRPRWTTRAGRFPPPRREPPLH